ncbi:MAG: T9SS type A sorting domain-containing protein, partial [Flavobacteriales bacterium]
VWGDTRNGRMSVYFAKTIASSNTTVNQVVLDGEETSWNIFPNPADDVLKLYIPKSLVGTKLNICNSSGILVYSELITSASPIVSIENLAAGNYFLLVGNEIKQFTKIGID